MKETSAIWLHLYPQKDIKVFVLEQGMDVFIPVFMWPDPLPSMDINPNTIVNDIRVTRKIFIKNGKNCDNKENYRYSGKRHYENSDHLCFAPENLVEYFVIICLQIVLQMNFKLITKTWEMT